MEQDVHHGSGCPQETNIKLEALSPQKESSILGEDFVCETVVAFEDSPFDSGGLNDLQLASPDDGSHLGEGEPGPSSSAPETCLPSTSTVEVEKQIFSFETDHLALRANDEYKSVMKILVLLEAQRVQAIQDLNVLEAEKKAALENPEEFVRRLQQGQLFLPSRQIVPEVPEIDYQKYSIPASYLGISPSTRTAGLEPDGQESSTSFQDTPSSSAASEETLTTAEVDRQVDPRLQQHPLKNRPETFNKPWSVEEQKKLEELLIRFPPEAVEAQRWRKIAAALGNRTVKQVASRVQKYFIKLAKAGLEVPGRMPTIPKSSRKVRRVQSTLKTQAFYLSTFFPQHSNPAIVIDPDAPSQERSVRLSEHCSSTPTASGGVVCAFCAKKLEGSFRFHCEDCSANLCAEGSCRQESNCVASGHNVRMVTDTLIDSDYIISNHYLDPNYHPSTS